MTHFLVVFDRAEGKVTRLQDYSSANEALSARFRAERHHRNAPSVEVVVLSARSRSELRRTHGRYFESVSQLAEDGLKQMDAATRV